MNTIVNLNVSIDKELELERQGFRRTRRWIGDAGQVADSRWYQAKEKRAIGYTHAPYAVSRVVGTKPSSQSFRSILARFLQLPNTVRKMAQNEV